MLSLLPRGTVFSQRVGPECLQHRFSAEERRQTNGGPTCLQFSARRSRSLSVLVRCCTCAVTLTQTWAEIALGSVADVRSVFLDQRKKARLRPLATRKGSSNRGSVKCPHHRISWICQYCACDDSVEMQQQDRPMQESTRVSHSG